MSVAIRFSVEGKKKQPIYRIIVIEKSKKRNGRNLEALGYYNPNVKPPQFVLDQKKYAEWIKKGAKPSFGLLKVLKK